MKIRFPKWLIYALLCIFWWGIFGFLSKIGSDKLPPRQVQIWFTFGTFPLLIPTLLRSRLKVGTDKLGVTYGTLTGFLAGIGNLALFAALEDGKADYQFVSYGGAQHSFTVPGIDKVGVKGLSYQGRADRRSWRAMQAHLREALGGKE